MPHSRDPVVLGLALTILRVSRGWKQRDLAAAVGLRPNSLSDYEKGKSALTRELLGTYASKMGGTALRVELAILAAEMVLLEFPETASPVEPSEEDLLRLEETIAEHLPTITSVEVMANAR